MVEMQYRQLGRSGLQVSALSYGAWTTVGDRCDLDASVELLTAAYEAGVNLFDNAEVYQLGGAEEVMGAALKRLGLTRETFLMSSKVFFGTIRPRRPNTWGLGRKHVIEGCHASLRRLGIDYLDLYFCHRPDPNTPLLETVRAMSDLVRQGKILYWGTSEWSSEQILEACRLASEHGERPPTVEQPEYNVFTRDRVETSLAQLHSEAGIGLVVWSPLKSGLLTGKYNEGPNPEGILEQPGYDWLRANVFGTNPSERMAAVRNFTEVAKQAGTTPAKLALAWVLRQPHVSSAITGASRPQQLRENIEALTLLPLSADLERAIELATQGITMNGPSEAAG